MTRRVRFTPLTCARAFVVAGLAATGVLTPSLAHASAVPFAPAADILTLAKPIAIASADIDRDGDLDVLASGSTRVTWIENSGGGSAWTEHVVSTNLGILPSVAAADVDGDGDMDVVALLSTPGTVFWYENSAGNGSVWVTHTVTTGLIFPISIATADVDGDGDVDILSGDSQAIRLHENVAGNGSLWAPHIVFTGASYANSI